MKYILIAFIIPFLFGSCTKEYTPIVKPEVLVSITGVKYVTTVNGSTGDYWKVTVAFNKAIDKGVHVTYSFDDNLVKGMSISHWVEKESTTNIFFTQYSANGSFSNVKLIRVDGADNYSFKLK